MTKEPETIRRMPGNASHPSSLTREGPSSVHASKSNEDRSDMGHPSKSTEATDTSDDDLSKTPSVDGNQIDRQRSDNESRTNILPGDVEAKEDSVDQGIDGSEAVDRNTEESDVRLSVFKSELQSHTMTSNGVSVPRVRSRETGTGRHEVPAVKYSGSLLDADCDVSVGSVESADNNGLDKPPSLPIAASDDKASLGARQLMSTLRENCLSPPPSSAESTSESSSSSSKGSNPESYQEPISKQVESNSIFRRGVSPGVSGSVPRIDGQDSGVNSIVSPSLTLSMSDNVTEDDKGLSVPFSRLHRIPYVHGSYATAAPIMLHDTKWMRILRRLMPESHADAVTILCQERKASTSLFPNAVRIMKWAENNPVVAAYGILNSDTGVSPSANREQRSTITSRFRWRRGFGNRSQSQPVRNQPSPMLEWDVFLDPTLVHKVSSALDAADDVLRSDPDDVEAHIAADVEVDRQVGRLISRMMLAHGSTSQLVAEAMGFSPRHNFASVVEQGESQRLHRRRRKSEKVQTSSMSRGLIDVWKAAESQGFTLPISNDLVTPVAPGKGRAKGAGIFVERWMAIFAAALQLGVGNDTIEATSALNEHGKLVESMEEDVEIRQLKPTMCGMFLCLGYEDPNSTRADHSKTSMAKSAKEIHRVLGAPLRLVLDLKSRRVPPRVWSRLVDTLRSRGVEVGGLGSFDIEELRSIGSLCSTPVTGVIFFHSAGDLQRACHANEVHRGDTVYFNAGSLIMPRPSIVAKLNCCQSEHYVADGQVENDDAIVFQPYAYPRGKIPKRFSSLECKSTVQDYQRRFDLRIGVYVQEFSICDRTLDAIARFVNDHPSTYNLGLAWGGINGKTCPGVIGDGYWNQRYMGRTWDLKAEPAEAMQLLHIEDHHLVKKAFRAGAWGHIGMVNPVNDVGGDATGDGAAINFEPCRPIE